MDLRRSYVQPIAIIILVFILGGCTQNSSSTATTDSTKVAGCSPDEKSNLDSLPYYQQLKSNWCWAASGQMCLSFMGKSISQCQEVLDKYGAKNCCSTGTPTDYLNPRPCNRIGWPDFANYKVHADSVENNTLPWDTIKRYVGCLGQPIVYSFRYKNARGAGHIMVITGYFISNGIPYLYVNDPLPGNGKVEIPYDEYKNSDVHKHWKDYYNIYKE